MGAAMYCVHCDKPITPGQAYKQIDKDSPSGAGAILHAHTGCRGLYRPLPPALRRDRRKRAT